MASSSLLTQQHHMDSDSDSDEDECCPICIEPLEQKGETKMFIPCPCNYRVCGFCVKRIQTEFDGRCPGCRRDYDESNFQFVDKPPQTVKRGRSKRKQAMNGPGNGHMRMASVGGGGAPQQYHSISTQGGSASSSSATGGFPSETVRRNLQNVRVVQRNLVYLVGLAPSIAKEETLKSNDFFGQYGKIIKVAVNRNDRDPNADPSRPPSYSAYITFARDEDARSAIKAVNGFWVDNYVIRASFGTTKYCNMFLKGLPCNNPECLYLHKLGDEASSFTKEQMHAGRGQFQDMTQVRSNDSSLPLTTTTSTATTDGNKKEKGNNNNASSATTSDSATPNAWGQPPPIPASGGWAAAAAAGTSKSSNPPSPVPTQPSSSSSSSDESSTTSTKGTKKQQQEQQQYSDQQDTYANGNNNEDSGENTPRPPSSTAVLPPSSGLSLLSSLNGLSLDEFNARHPDHVKPKELAPGPNVQNQRQGEQKPHNPNQNINVEVEAARAQLLQQRILQQQSKDALYYNK